MHSLLSLPASVLRPSGPSPPPARLLPRSDLPSLPRLCALALSCPRPRGTCLEAEKEYAGGFELEAARVGPGDEQRRDGREHALEQREERPRNRGLVDRAGRERDAREEERVWGVRGGQTRMLRWSEEGQARGPGRAPVRAMDGWIEDVAMGRAPHSGRRRQSRRAGCCRRRGCTRTRPRATRTGRRRPPLARAPAALGSGGGGMGPAVEWGEERRGSAVRVVVRSRAARSGAAGGGPRTSGPRSCSWAAAAPSRRGRDPASSPAQTRTPWRATRWHPGRRRKNSSGCSQRSQRHSGVNDS